MHLLPPAADHNAIRTADLSSDLSSEGPAKEEGSAKEEGGPVVRRDFDR